MTSDSRRIRVVPARDWLLVLALALLSSCAATPPPPPEENPIPRLPLPPLTIEPVAVSQPDPSTRPASVRLLDEGRYTLNVQDADLASVLLGLGRQSPLNIVVEPGVEGIVTADLKDVTLLEILDQIVVPRGFYYEVRRNLLRIHPTNRQTRTYRVDYPNYSRKGESDLTITGAIASKVDVGSASSDGGEDISSSGVQTTQTVDFWTELEDTLNAIVFGASGGLDTDSTETAGDEEGGEGEAGETSRADPPRRVLVSRQSALVTVTAETRVLADVERFLEEVARSTGLQVLIDAQIIEVTLKDELNLGFDFEGAPNLGSDTAGVFSRLITPGLREAMLVQSLAPTLTEGGFSFGLANDDFGVILQALAKQTDVRVVSTPRIATLNNHKALIKVVRNEVFFIAEAEVAIVQNVGQAPVVEFVPQIVPVGVTLDVTPYVSDDNEVTMHIHPSVSEVVDEILQPKASNDQPQVGSLPVIDLRETDTVLRIQAGQTIVIGGLIQSTEIDVERKVPLLGDIPGLGRLFRNSAVEERRSELLILLTPTILDAPRIVRVTEAAGQSLGRTEALRQSRLHESPWWRKPFGESYGVK